MPAITENFNPNGAGCFVAKAPRGCEADPDVPCERGQDINKYEFFVGLGFIFIYLIFPPFILIGQYCWISRVSKKARTSTGMNLIRECAQREMLRSAAKQLSLYLLSFWFTWALSLVQGIYGVITRGLVLYNLIIVAHSLQACQGLVFGLVYFALDRMGKPKVPCVPSPRPRSDQLTVSGIRRSALDGLRRVSSRLRSSNRSSIVVFNIFDGVADADSPWAKFIDGDYDDESVGKETAKGEVGASANGTNGRTLEQFAFSGCFPLHLMRC